MSFENLLASNDGVFDDKFSDKNMKSDTTKRTKFLGFGVEKLMGQQAFFDSFLRKHPHLQGLEFIEQLLEHFEFSFQTPWKEKERIPAEGRIVIVSNHPLGTLDAAALYKLVSDIRPDVRVIVEQSKSELRDLSESPLASVILPYDMSSDQLPDNGPSVNSIACDYLREEGALIFFPCDDVSRIRPTGVSDPKWRGDFLRLALAAQTPILPVFIDATNSALFYGLSAVYKPLSELIRVPEMYKQTRKSVSIRVGDLVAYDAFSQSGLPIKTQVKLFKKHVYKIGKGKDGVWPTRSAVAHPESRKAIKQLVASQRHIGHTSDHKQIYLYQNAGSCSVLREIGRLREIAFRAIGEGTGQRRDIDQYDAYYSQLLLWDDQDLEIVGAYRLAKAAEIIQNKGLAGLYSASLFDYQGAMHPILEQGAELGRSFVQPKYWGKRSLDYLWYGIGSFLSKNPEIRYLFGPVSLSNDMPKAAKDLMVYFFSLYFGQAKHQQAFLESAMDDVNVEARLKMTSGSLSSTGKLASSKHPYNLSSELINNLKERFSGDDYKGDFKTLKHILSNMGCSVPTLFKQYSDLCEPGGLVFLDFGIDADFADCIDGLVIVDVRKIKAKKRARYIPELGGTDDQTTAKMEQENQVKGRSDNKKAMMLITKEG